LNNKLIDGIFCDLEKEFECVYHKMLLSKPDFYSKTHKHYKLYKSYLANRYQRTLLYNKDDNIITSGWPKVKHAVPQGLVLCPLLFLIFVNDIPRSVWGKSVPFLCADDTSILLSHPNPSDFNDSINNVFILNYWFKQNCVITNKHCPIIKRVAQITCCMHASYKSLVYTDRFKCQTYLAPAEVILP